ncbi:MAG: type I phosphomannose isomerase catalytic subunit [Halanaerobiales bacterium]|nr:type I phosphomannose isomerase catalytic subunit [Halanaerobiales bacterium]
MELYPLKFFPIYKKKIWGGNRLKSSLDKKINEENIGESWEISSYNDSISIVSNGRFKSTKLTTLIKRYPKEIMGSNFNSNDKFPLLLKIIDANKKLSVQVHPDEKTAKNIKNSDSKYEMWYILDAKKDAKLYLGLKNIQDKSHLEEVINKGKLKAYLNAVNVKKGDFFYIPGGTVHAIGEGLMLIEIQQSSDTTYRLYDWDRLGSDGKPRDLHLQNGIKATNLSWKDLNQKVKYINKTKDYIQEILNISKYFVTEKINVNTSFNMDIENFVLLTCINNKGEIIYNNKSIPLKKGESMMLPAGLKEVKIKGNIELLSMYIPKSIKNYKNNLLENNFTKI